jgi:hypothetical protein
MAPGKSPPERRRSSARLRGVPASQRDLIRTLSTVAEQLESIYSTCVMVQLALRGQNADQDADIARSLRVGVSQPISLQAEKLRTIVSKLNRGSRAGRGKR